MNIEVQWFGCIANNLDYELAVNPPTPILPFLIKKYGSKLDYWHCPSKTEYLKNVYLITSPVNFVLDVDQNEKVTFKHNESIFTQNVIESNLETQTCLDFPLNYYFINKNDNVTIDLIDPPLIHLPFKNFCGSFNISKICRPTNFTCIPAHGPCTINIKRGDPLYAVKFNTAQKVVLKQIVDSNLQSNIMNQSQKVISLKNIVKNTSLSDLYQNFSKYMKQLWKNS